MVQRAASIVSTPSLSSLKGREVRSQQPTTKPMGRRSTVLDNPRMHPSKGAKVAPATKAKKSPTVKSLLGGKQTMGLSRKQEVAHTVVSSAGDKLVRQKPTVSKSPKLLYTAPNRVSLSDPKTKGNPTKKHVLRTVSSIPNSTTNAVIKPSFMKKQVSDADPQLSMTIPSDSQTIVKVKMHMEDTPNLIPTPKPSKMSETSSRIPTPKPSKVSEAPHRIPTPKASTVEMSVVDPNQKQKKIVYQEFEKMIAPKGQAETFRQQIEEISKAHGGGKVASQGKCGICNKSLPTSVRGICTHCRSQFQNNNIKVGTLEEFKVYANNVAHSVKKVVAIGEKRDDAKVDVKKDELIKTLKETLPLQKEVSKAKPRDPTPAFQRNKTEMSLSQHVPKMPAHQQSRSSSFDIEKHIFGANALVPVQCMAEKALAIGSSTDGSLFTNMESDSSFDNALSLIPASKVDPSCSLLIEHPDKMKILEMTDSFTEVAKPLPEVQEDVKKFKKSKTFAHPASSKSEKEMLMNKSKVKIVKAIGYPSKDDKDRMAIIQPDKSSSMMGRAKTEMGFGRNGQRESRGGEKDATNPVRPSRDKSSSVDPEENERKQISHKDAIKVKDAISKMIETMGANSEDKAVVPVPSKEVVKDLVPNRKRAPIQTRSVTFSNMNRHRAIEKDGKRSSQGKGARGNELALARAIPSSRKSKKQDSQKCGQKKDDDDEDEEDPEEGFDKTLKSPVNRADIPNINLTSEAIIALEKQRKKPLWDAESNRAMPSTPTYFKPLTGQEKSSKADENSYQRPQSSQEQYVFDPPASRSTSLVDTRKMSLVPCDKIYYDDSRDCEFEEELHLEKRTPDPQIDDESYYTYCGSQKIEESFKETDIDDGRYVYVSTDNQVKSGYVQAEDRQMIASSNEEIYTTGEEDTSPPDASPSTALNMDLVLGSGENPTLKASTYWDGLLGTVYQFAKDITMKQIKQVKKESEAAVQKLLPSNPTQDSMYTGGFFNKRDMFYCVNTSQSTVSSVSSNMYYDVDNMSCDYSTDSSKSSDIYTGEVFMTTRCDKAEPNTRVVPPVLQDASSPVSRDTAEDGSANNSTRNTSQRVSRRQRVRPPVDFLIEKSFGTADFLSKALLSSVTSYNTSNNSSNDYFFRRNGFGDDDGEVHSSRQIRSSSSQEYVDFSPFMKARMEANDEPKTEQTNLFDYSRYEKMGNTSPKFFFTSNENDNSHYGPNMARQEEGRPSSMESPPYASNLLSKYSNENNSSEYTGNTNNNYPNYEQLYTNMEMEREAEERKRREEMERLRREQEAMYSYSSGFDFRGAGQDTAASYSSLTRDESPPVQMGAPFNMAAAWGTSQEPDAMPSYFSEPQSPRTLNQARPMQQTPKGTVRPMLMKLGHITVRNNVEDDNDYAANINMDLKGGPGAHPVPFGDDRTKVAETPYPEEQHYQDDTYSSIYSNDVCYADVGPAISSWRDQASPDRSRSGSMTRMERPATVQSPKASTGNGLKPSFPTDRPKAAQQQRRR